MFSSVSWIHSQLDDRAHMMQHVCFIDATQAHAIVSTLGWGPSDTFVWSKVEYFLETMTIFVVLL